MFATINAPTVGELHYAYYFQLKARFHVNLGFPAHAADSTDLFLSNTGCYIFIYMLKTSKLVVFGVGHYGPCMLQAWSCVSFQDMAGFVSLYCNLQKKRAKRRYPILVIEIKLFLI